MLGPLIDGILQTALLSYTTALFRTYIYILVIKTIQLKAT